MKNYMKYVYEFIGTFFLVFTVGMVILEPYAIGLLAPLAIGAALTVFVYAGGHISGGHYNPAVSLAAFMSNKLSRHDLWMYWIVQFIAAIVAALLTIYFKGETAPDPIDIDLVKGLIAEFIFTFALCFVVLNVAAAKATEGNSYFGLAIGLSVMVGAYSIGTISGAALNPAVALGLTVLNFSALEDLWIYLVAGALAGVVAAYAFKAAHPENATIESTRSI